jgi:hypothetical protein
MNSLAIAMSVQRAREPRRTGPQTQEKSRIPAMEARWLSLAEGGSLVERLNNFLAGERLYDAQPEVRLGTYRQVVFEKGQVLIAPGQEISTVFFSRRGRGFFDRTRRIGGPAWLTLRKNNARVSNSESLKKKDEHRLEGGFQHPSFLPGIRSSVSFVAAV